MEGIWIVFLIIWFVARLNKNRAGKTGKFLTKLEKTETGKALRDLQEALSDRDSDTDEERGDAGEAPEAPRPVPQAVAPGAGFSAAAEVDLARRRHDSELVEGESRQDDEGCIGGSLEHGHDEDAQAAARKAESARAGDIASRTRITAAQMRRAVIASEVLRAPLALRGKRRGFVR